MKCFFCRQKTRDVIRCKSCVGAVKTPISLFKGGGWAGSSVSLQSAGQARSFDKRKAPTYSDLKNNGYLDYAKKNTEKFSQ